ncbi:PREDICTED: mediator-associated protein 1-like [Brassica oleracea var. oleracea]|uniref:Uncharacterized protein n=1 Tax=Brassica oleracea var. oleracea TaxID=109376 RepID=A0A0D3BVI2_BRAOL|nr:PREDICTED: mediator-associated protein 1-like [Brassica oleracea var. oleracea]
MTKKRDPLENPPAASSSGDDDEVDSSAGEEEEREDDDDASSSEEELPVKSHSSSAAVTIAVPGKTAAQQASDLDSGSETETDSDSDTEQPPNQRSGKAILAAAKSKKEKSPPPATKSGTKRPSEGTSNETNSKRAKKTGEDSKKPPAFQRLWTEEDEIAVLQGMIVFKNDTGNSPYDDTNAYYDYIKKSISFEVSKNQFMDKLRSLKKKYMGKEKPSFTKPHDQKSYRLCMYIWGPDGMGLETAVKSNGVSKKKTMKLDSVKQDLSFASSPNGKAVVDDDKRVLVLGGDVDRKCDWFENSFLVRGIAGFGVDEHYVKQRWSLVPVETKKTVEEKVKMLQAKEIEFVLQKTKILHEVTSMIAEASKNKP